MEEEKKVKEDGAFLSSLKRQTKKIKEDRAIAIAEDTEILYKRQIEDLRIGIKRMYRELENMLDLSPETTTGLVLASDFHADEYVRKDLEIGVKIRNDEIKLEIAMKRYSYLFGEVI